MAPGQDLTTFGIERDYEYIGHTTVATHLVPLPRRVFASTDETHIKIWGLSGDLVKTTFPSNRRSMVSAMTYCSTFSALLTAEVDMTLKAYATSSLDLLDTFPLGQAQKKGEKNALNEKVLSMVYLPQHSWVLLGSEGGCDLWWLGKSLKRRAGGSVGRLEHHLQLQILKRVTSMPVFNIVADLAEQRVIMWGPKSLSIYDTELNMITNCRQPPACSVRCACIQILTILETSLLTGGDDGNVNFWSIQGTQKEKDSSLDDSPKEKDEAALVSMRLEHTFRGHSRTVEVVNFYQKKQSGAAPSLCVSYSRDGRMKVWSLVEFSIVYTLDVSLLDSKVFIFPLAQHCFAVSAAAPESAGTGQGQRTTLSLMRFTSHVACPFATTNQSPVILITRPLPPSDFRDSDRNNPPQSLSGAVALVSEDVAVRIVDAEAKRLIACLPPPPNSKVQVLRVFIVQVWQILVLWLSSQEIAVFFVPTAGPSQNNEAAKDAESNQSQETNRAVRSTTPLLIRRFSIFEVRAHAFDKELPKEAFRSVALHHGKAPPYLDTCAGSSLESGPQDASTTAYKDWFLIIGTQMGTLQAFRLRAILAASPIWHRIVKHLPRDAWEDARSSQDMSSYLPSKTYNVASGIEKSRLEAFEADLLEAMQASKVPGQRPFPRDAPALQFHGRWRCHDYFVDRTEAVHDTLMTLDMKRNMKLWDVETMQCIFRYRLDEFTCYTPYLTSCHNPEHVPQEALRRASTAESEVEETQRRMFSGITACAEDVIRFTGLALGSNNGGLQLVMVDKPDCREPESIVSTAVHGKAVLQIDYIWPINVFATIGGDYTLKIWTHALVLIREVVFPQPLTSVAFRHRNDADSNGGHGDILLGFSSHVASISFEFWTRGIPEHMIGRNAARGRAFESRSFHFTKRGFPVLDASDEIGDHQLWLHAEDPIQARQHILSKKGVTLQGAAFVIRFKEAMMSTLRMAPPPSEEIIHTREQVRQGDILDFRGEPLVDLASLSGQAVDRAKLDLTKRCSKEPSIRHKRTNHHNKGDFESYTHDHSHYYDKNVVPNYIVDAPRSNAIRGVGDEKNSALITSVGSQKSRSRDAKNQSDARSMELEVLPDTVLDSEKEMHEKIAADIKPIAVKTAHATRARKRRFSQQESFHSAENSPTSPGGANSNDQNGNDGVEQGEHGDVPATEDSPQHDLFSDTQEEPWRNRHVARGTPREEFDRPRLQAVANTDLDTARLLVSRGHISEVPDIPEENQLKRLLVKKTEWLYSPSESHILAQKRTTIQRMQEEHGAKQIWTPTGRLVCGEGAPPTSSVPWSARPLMKPRMPITRSEVTEMRIIERAAQPPSSPPQFTIDARRSRYIPMDARSTSTSSRVETQHSHKSLAESSQAPALTAR